MPHSTAAPGPSGWPLLGSLTAFRRDPLGFLTRAAEQYGPVVRYRMGPRQVWLVNDWERIRDILVTHGQKFTIGLVLEKARALLGQGLLTSTEPLHLRQRRLMQPAFHRERLMGYGRVMSEYAAQARETWRDGATLDIAEEMMRLTMLIVGQTLFNARVDEDAESISRSMHAVISVFPTLLLPFSHELLHLPLPMSRRYQKAKAQLDGTIYRVIEQRRKSGEDAGDLLSMLLMAKGEDGEGMSDQQVHDETLTLFLAGHETTANALTWTWYLLAQRPDVVQRVEQELEETLSGRLPEPEDVPRLRFLDQVLTESLRLYPTAWAIARRPIEPYPIGEFVIPAGDVVLMSPYVMHRRPEFYENPNEFLPERWTPEFRDSLPKFAYFPFGAGTRQCIGERFAWMEAMLLLATIAQKWRFHLDPTHSVQPKALITLRTRDGVKVRAERRDGFAMR